MRHIRFKIVPCLFVVLAMFSCNSKNTSCMPIETDDWGNIGSDQVKLITMTNENGMQVKISNYGGAIVSVEVPDREGEMENVVLGFDNLEQYQGDHPFFGSIIGRYANRIADAQFTLNDVHYTLNASDGKHSLHGGLIGYHKKVFTIDRVYVEDNAEVLELSLLSPDMDEGYPGNLKVVVTYALTNDNELRISYKAETDKPTVVNLTNHSYFNLTGLKESVLNHEVVLIADSITPTDSTLIPTGELLSVLETAFDFTTPHIIGERIAEVPGGYDVNFKLNKKGSELSLAAEVYEPTSGRFMQVFTTEPGIQFYSGNFLDGTYVGQQGKAFDQYSGLCLEAQHFPDSPNQLQFPKVTLEPEETYTQQTIYKFGVK